MNTLPRTLTVLAALALHQTARALRHIAVVTKPTDVYVPEDAPVTFTTSPWYYRPNNLVIEDQEDPVHAYPHHVMTLPVGITLVTTTDNSGHGSDDAHVYVLLTPRKDPWALFGRDEEGYHLNEDHHEVV